jgi:phosphatidylinositol alpha-1,6-mannosyltransferase
MKILFLSWNYPPARGGIERLVENLFHALSARHEVRLLTAHAGGAPDEPGVERAPKPGIAAYLWFVFRRGWSLCRADRPDVILCGTVVPAPVAVLLRWRFGVPFVVPTYGSDILREGWLYQMAFRWLLRRAATVVAVSGQTRNLLAKRGFDPAAIRVIYPGVKAADFDRRPAAIAPELEAMVSGRKVVLTVGRLIRRKGVLEFVEGVMPQLCRDRPDVLYLVVGDDAKASLVHHERLRDRIAARVGELGLDSHVRLLGSLSDADLLALYFRSHVFVLPCLDIPGDVEGFGIVFLEAALAGMPSAATRVGGIPEAVEDGVTGLIVPPGDPAAMCNAVERLLSDDTLRSRMAAAGADRARRAFGWPAIASRYEKVLEAAVARAAGRLDRPA